MIANLFSGADGWAVALKNLGRTDVLGFDNNAAAVATAHAAGHVARCVALGDHPTTYLSRPVTGLVASPPCPGFSAAGLKLGRGDIPLILAAVDALRYDSTPDRADEIVTEVRSAQKDQRSALSLEPLRWVLDTKPQWTAWEQVPSVLPLWEACAEVLRAAGYHVWAGKVHAEQYGVPQARTRAVLVAKRVTHGGRPGAAFNFMPLSPLPSHSRYHTHKPGILDPRVQPWVSMATALNDSLGHTWLPRAANDGTTWEDMVWVYKRPAPTMVGSFRLDVAAKPAYRKAGDTPRQKAPGSVLLTVAEAEAGVLQSFPRDYPWQGTEAEQRLQIGNAIPPLLAQAILERVL